MDATFSLQGLVFEWDLEKAKANIDKHGVRFEEAAEVFFDAFNQIGDASTDDEDREFVLGESQTVRLLFVVNIERGEKTRIISARSATKSERKQYQDARRN